MTTIALAYSSVQKRVFFVNWKAICIISFGFGCVLMFVYAFFVISLINGTYVIKDYQIKIASLSKESRGLEVSFAETGFMGTINQKAEAMNFEKTASVKYIQILEPALAKAK